MGIWAERGRRGAFHHLLFAIRRALRADGCFCMSAFAQDRVADRPAAFVDAAAVVPGLMVDARYAGSHNFVGRPIDGYEAPRCFLTKPAAEALAQVARDLAAQGLMLKAFDCYRPARAVANFVRWAHDLNDTVGKREFYPEVDKRMLFRDSYLSSRSGHSRGSTVDLTLARADGTSSKWAHRSIFSVRARGPARRMSVRRRRKSGAVRRRHAPPRFSRLSTKEWWHFTLAHEPFPDTYFDFPVK